MHVLLAAAGQHVLAAEAAPGMGGNSSKCQEARTAPGRRCGPWGMERAVEIVWVGYGRHAAPPTDQHHTTAEA